MALQAHFGIRKGQLAWLSDLPDQRTEFVGLPTYKNELQAHHKVSQIGIEEEGGHLKCNLVFCAFLAIVAASGATWLFLTQGQGGFTPAICLTAISAGFVITMLIMAALTLRKQRGLENEYEAQASATVRPEVILQAMRHPEVSCATIQTIVGRLDDDQRKEFIQEAYNSDTTQELPPGQEKIFKALMADPALLELIAQKERGFALTMLQHADLESLNPLRGPLFDALVLKIGAPASPEEAALLSKCPTALQRYSATLENGYKIPYQFAFLKYAAADTPRELVQRWLVAPTSPEQANILAQHYESVAAYVKQPYVDLQFALKMLRYLSKDSHPKLLGTLMASAGPPASPEGAELYNNHPGTLSQVISQDGNFAIGYLQVARESIVPLENVAVPQSKKDIASYAQEPKAVARLALTSPLWFGPSVVFSMFSVMHIQNQIAFLKEMDTKNPSSTAVVSFFLHKLLTKTFAQKYDHFPEAGIKPAFKELLRQFGRWPELVAQRIFGEVETKDKKSDFGTENSLLQHELFVRLFFQSMDEVDREACIGHAAARLSQHGEKAVTECTQWLMIQKFPDWLSSVLAHSPGVLAKALCSNENDRSYLQGIEIAGKMPPEQLKIYEQKLMEYFLAHYEKAVFDDKKGSSALTDRLIDRLRYLQIHPEWAENYPLLAKRYIELSVNANIKTFDVQATLMASRPNLFDPFTVTFNGFKDVIPACRIVALSPVLANHLTSGMKGVSEKTLTLGDVGIEEDVANAFMHYLKNGMLPEEPNLLALSYLAHFYEMGHLSALCAQALEAALSKETYKDILEAAVTYKLWDLLTICLDFISRHSRDSDIVDYSQNAPVGPISDFIGLGIRCSKLNIKVSYQAGKEEVLTSPQFGRYLSIPMGIRGVHLGQHRVTLTDLMQLMTLITPTNWSTKNYQTTIELALFVEKAPQNPAYALLPIFLQCAEEEILPEASIAFGLKHAMTLYTLASQHKKQNLAAVCLQHIQKNLTSPDLALVLGDAYEHQLQDLKLISLIFISHNSTLPDILTLKEAVDFDGMDNQLAPTFTSRSLAIKKLIELGITCANEEIEISYLAGEHHVTVKCYTEDNPKRNFKGNKDRVLTALTSLHKIRPINHLHGAYLDSIHSETKFLGTAVQYHIYRPPKPQ